MRPHSGPFLSFLAYYIRAPSDEFLCIEYGAPSDQFLRLLWRLSHVCFLHNIWGPRSISLHTIYLGLQLPFFAYYMGAPQISFFLYNMGSPLRSVPLLAICPSPPPPPPPPPALRSVYLHTILGWPPQNSFFTKHMGGPSDQFLSLLYEAPLRLISALTIWGPFRSVSPL